VKIVSSSLAVMLGLLGAPPPPPPRGLHAFPGGDGKRHVHLRVDGGGGGVLFIDVTDVIHLNPTATEMAWWVLCGGPRRRVLAGLRHRAGGTTRQLARDLDRVTALIDGLRQPGHCPSCDAHSFGAEQHPLFSVAVDAPFKADLALTYTCNNACLHCYNPAARRTMRSLDPDGWRAVLQRLAAIGVPHVIFTGGEPTLVPALPALIRHATGLGLIAGMNTNGRRLADPATTAELTAAGLDHVQITLESSRAAVHDAMTAAPSFQETVAGIRAAVASRLHVLTNTTITRRNRDHVVEVVDLVADLGLRTVAMNGMIHAGHGRGAPDALAAEELAPVLVQVRDRAAARGLRLLWYTPTDYCRLSPLELELGPRRCNAAEYSVCIEPNGDVLPCQSCYEPAGNLLADPWEAIWNSPGFLRFRQRVDDPVAGGLPAECHDCPDLNLCAGGCRLEREACEVHRDRATA